MASSALEEWRGERSARLSELFDAHRRIGGAGSGRRWQTEQVNWALVLRLAGEFQGFARALHDEAVDHFVRDIGASNPARGEILRAQLVANRGLDKGNAEPGKLGGDFGRLGIAFWSALRARYARAGEWQATMTALNRARNAIAHANEADIAGLAADGWNLRRLETVRRFRRSADNLAVGMDTVGSSYLERLIGGGPPW